MLAVFVSTGALANYPVFDYSAYMQSLDMIGKMKKQLDAAKRQFDELKNINKSNMAQLDFLKRNNFGNFGFGNLMNGSGDLHKRQWSQNSWVDVLNASNSGHSSGFNAAQDKYRKLYPVEDAARISSTRPEDNLTRTHYQQSRDISRAALSASAFSYDQINEHIKNLHDMLAKLESSPSEKAAIDLNTRLVAELGFIQIEMLRQQNIQNQLMATQTQGVVNGLSDQSKFMQ